MVQTAKPTLEAALVCFNDPERRSEYLEFYAEDVVLHGYPPDLPPGREGAAIFYQMIWSAFPDAAVTVHEILEEGDRIAALYSLQGTHRGDFMGIPASDATINVPGMTIIRFEDNRFAERWNVLEQLTMLQQLGAVPGGS